jgi:SPX domain protein involved in polyphosphate accumulation
MKFSNQLDASMVPEWRQHYMDYKALKKKLKQVRASTS